MNGDRAMRDDNDKGNWKYCYIGNQFHCYLPIKISNPTSLPLIPGLRGESYSTFCRNSPQCARNSTFIRSLDHTQRRNIVIRTPLYD